jgi:serine/threonine protein kinase
MLLVMEYVANGCLREYLKQHENNIALSELMRFCREIAAVSKCLIDNPYKLTYYA